MKKIGLVFLFGVATTCSAYADSPFDQGIYTFSGSIAYASARGDDGIYRTSYGFNPHVSYFILPGLAVGATLSYKKEEFDVADVETTGVGPTLRYYVDGETIYPFFGVEYNYLTNSVSQKTSDRSLSVPDTAHELVAVVGVDYFISEYIAIEPQVKYVFRSEHYSTVASSLGSDIDSDETRASIGVSIFLH
jgi:outer membrane protein W